MMAHPPRATVRSRSPGDAELMRRIAEGDSRALGELYDRHARGLLRFAARMASWNEAEDVVHDVFMRVLRLAPEFDPRAESARPWLYALTSRTAQQRRRSLRRWADALVRVARERPPASTCLRESDADLERALSRLHPKKREVLLLAEVEGFTSPEIARLLRIPIGTVWTRLHHARRALRQLVEASR